MRVVIITWEYPPRIIGDIANYVKKLASMLVNNGNDVFVVTFHDSLRGIKEQKDGVNVYRVGNPVDPHLNILTWNLTLAAEIERAVSDIYYSVQGAINLIDAHEWLSVVPSVVIKKVFNIPFVYSLYSLEEHRATYAEKPLNLSIKNLEQLGINESRKILVNSNWLRSEVKRLRNVPYTKIISIDQNSPTWDAHIKSIYRKAC